jgi:hypothetical protein
VAALVRVPVADPRLPRHLAKAPVEPAGRVHRAVLLAEHQVEVVPHLACRPPLAILHRLVSREGSDPAANLGRGQLRMVVMTVFTDGTSQL